MTAPRPMVAIILGSKSDVPHLEGCTELLAKFDVDSEMVFLSAHRQPDALVAWVAEAERRGVEVFICAAGLAAHLPGAVAARTVLPVIGIPLPTSDLNGMDSLLSIVQMPGGIPVATVTVGRAGAKNAAVLAAEILALKYPAVRERLLGYRTSLAG